MTPNHRRARRSRRGMTLFEVLVALGILLVMSGVIFQALHNSIEFHNLLSMRDETVRTARAALSKLTRDLQLAYLTPNKLAVNSYQTVFAGFDEEPARLYFASLNHERLYLDSRECDQTEITVWGTPAPEGRGVGYVLYHREAPRIDEEPDEQGVIWPLAYNVRSLKFRYLDQANGEWKDEWDSRGPDTPYRLPRAVEIGLVLIAPDPEDETGERTVDVPFLSRVVLEYAARLPNASDALVAAQMAAAGGTGTGASTGTDFSQPGSGGYGGIGTGGLGGGTLGGTLGTMFGQQQQSKPSGRGPARAPARPTAAPGFGGQR